MQTVRPTDGMEITESVRLQPGDYHLPHGIKVTKSGVCIRAEQVRLIGERAQNCGLSLTDLDDVSIHGLELSSFYHGIRARRCKNLRIDSVAVFGTAEIAPNTVFLDIWKPAQDSYGGGVMLWECEDSAISKCLLQHQQSGVLTYGCLRLTLSENQCNYNSGFGIHLNATSDSVFERNSCDYCCRFEPREGGLHNGHMGADAAGFLIVNGSCRNRFLQNSARLGGDGFFLAGMMPDGTRNGCNHNLFVENDASLSPNIAFESTFCEGNVFQRNYADRCNYGFWCGYSRDFILEGNRALFARQAGIAAENGVGFQVLNNHFQSCQHGVLLWSGGKSDIEKVVPERTTCKEWLIEKNTFTENWSAIRIGCDMDHGIRKLPQELWKGVRPESIRILSNDIQGNHCGIQLSEVRDSLIKENLFHENALGHILLQDCEAIEVGHNLGSRGAYL